jgi:type II secretory pathway component PulF
MSEINESQRNIMTIEDPVEYVFPSINQISTNEQAGLTFATGLKSILRQDPDVILVGEIRDVDTARIATQSALTGHFVLSSLHATDAVAALHRFLDMGIESFLIASSVVGVVGQRLLRRNCKNCKKAYKPSPRRWRSGSRAAARPRRSSTAGSAATSAAAPASPTASASTSCSPSPRDQAPGGRLGDAGRASAHGHQAGHAHHARRGRWTSCARTRPPSPKSSATSTRAEGSPCPSRSSSRPRRRPGAGPGGEEVDLQFELTKKKVARKDLMHFSRQLAVFIKAGIPILDALDAILEEMGNSSLREIATDVASGLREGSTFAAAIAVHSDAFPTYYVGILRSAELTGRLDDVLEQLGDYIERDMEARRKVTSALAYPAVIMATSLAVIVILVAFVLPKFEAFFSSLNAELPLPTRLLLGTTAAISDNLVWIALGLVLVLAVAWTCVRTARGRSARDRLLLRLPVVGDLIRHVVLERFCRILSAMMTAGVPLPEAMAVTSEATTNTVYRRGIDQAAEAMMRGEGLAARS